MPPRKHDVELLQLGGSREHNVCVPGRVSEELLAHHGEKIFPLEASDDLVLFRDNDRRIGVVDEHGSNGRIKLVFTQECRAEAPLIQHTCPGLDPIRPHKVFPFDWEGPNWQLQDTAANSAPRTDEGRKTRGSPHRLAAACVAFDSDADADHARLSGRVFSSQSSDVLRRNGGDLGDPFGRVGLDALPKLLEALSIVLHVLAIDQTLADDNVYHTHRERRIGAWSDGKVPVGFAGCPRLDRIDHDQLCALAFRLSNKRPVVQIGADGIACPQNDVFRMLEALWIHAGRGTYRHEIGRARARITKGPLADGGAKPVKEGVAHIQPVKDALGAQIAIWQDRGWSVLADDPSPVLADRLEGFVPADTLELSGPFRSGAFERV